jgi:hypothetical protein
LFFNILQYPHLGLVILLFKKSSNSVSSSKYWSYPTDSLGLNKFFKIERIGDVQILDSPFEYADKHESSESDVFGFNDTGEKHHVSFQLSM